MHIFEPFDLIVFDCDGVLLDSNNMKVESMEKALRSVEYFSDEKLAQCMSYFVTNFGKSRFHHIKYFVGLLSGAIGDSEKIEKIIIERFSKQVEKGYQEASLAKDVLHFLEALSDKRLFVASGSEQKQLDRVFKSRGLGNYFNGILGSPTTKQENIANILKNNPHEKALMIGDALADYEAAKSNNIEFMFYSPLSNVKQEMLLISEREKFYVINDYLEVLQCR